jgi:hypothetical protein
MTNLGATPSTSNLFQNDWLAFRQNVRLTKRRGTTKSPAFLRKAFLKEKPFGKVNHSLFTLLVCLSVCPSVHTSDRLSASLPACLRNSYVFPTICLSVHTIVFPSVHLSVFLPTGLLACLSNFSIFYLSVCPSARRPVCLYLRPICLPVCLPICGLRVKNIFIYLLH